MNISFSIENDSIQIDKFNTTDIEIDQYRRSNILNQEYKDLLSRKFKLNNEIEQKMKSFESITKENSDLKTANSDLTIELDKVNKSFRDRKTENHIISSKKINEIKSLYTIEMPDIEKDEEIIKSKEEYEYLEINLK